MNDHHLILGQLKDFLSGRTIDDTHDERYRQKIARLLVQDRGYAKADIAAHQMVTVKAGTKCAELPVTFLIHVESRASMLIHYGPGSLVTRYRPALALARLVMPYQIPYVVVTNGEAADILDGRTGKVISTGLDLIPEKGKLKQALFDYHWEPVAPERREKEARIVMAFEVDDRCPCDNTVCKIDENGKLKDER